VKALKCGHHLRDLLIVPVQRIPVCSSFSYGGEEREEERRGEEEGEEWNDKIFTEYLNRDM
jgi:hypothetical protein